MLVLYMYVYVYIYRYVWKGKGIYLSHRQIKIAGIRMQVRMSANLRMQVLRMQVYKNAGQPWAGYSPANLGQVGTKNVGKNVGQPWAGYSRPTLGR